MNRSAILWLVNADGTPGYTWSPTTGCGPGLPCYERCWAREWHTRFRGGDFSVKLHPERLDEPLRLRKPSVIGVCLMGDLFHDDVPESFIGRVATIVSRADRQTFVFLTKRATRMWQMANCYSALRLSSCWLGISVEDQATADERVWLLLNTPAAHRWVSLEPQIGPVDLSPFLGGINLVVQGCESGPRRRPFDVLWAQQIRDACKAAGVAYYLKQMPGWCGDEDACGVVGGHCNGECSGCYRVIEKPYLDGRQHVDLPWSHREEGGGG